MVLEFYTADDIVISRHGWDDGASLPGQLLSLIYACQGKSPVNPRCYAIRYACWGFRRRSGRHGLATSGPPPLRVGPDLFTKISPIFLAHIETYSRRIPDRKICGYFWGLIPNSARLCAGAMVVLRQCRHRRQSRVGHQPTRADSTEGIDAATARVSRCPAGRLGCPQGAVDKMVMQTAQISASTYECCLGVASLRRVLAESIKPLDGSVFPA